MRKKRQKQIPFMPQEMDHPQAKELEAISQILDSKFTSCMKFFIISNFICFCIHILLLKLRLSGNFR
jgi:DNA topoisomerase VI subunit B